MPQQRRRKAGILPTAHAEYLVLADAVEALNGKLYMMGGGWDTMYIRDLGSPVALSFACGVAIPWNVTDDDHTLTVDIRDPDGAQIAPPFALTFRTGRPPTLERGAAMHLPFAVKGEFTFPSYGSYTIHAAVDSGDGGRQFQFFVRPPQAVSAP